METQWQELQEWQENGVTFYVRYGYLWFEGEDGWQAGWHNEDGYYDSYGHSNKEDAISEARSQLAIQ